MLSRVSIENTTPTEAPARATNGKDLDPTSSSCRISSRHSYGGVTKALNTCQAKMPISPNHSKNPVRTPEPRLAAGAVRVVRRSGWGGFGTATAVIPRSLNDLDRGLVSRAHCSDACEKARSGARYTGTQG